MFVFMNWIKVLKGNEMKRRVEGVGYGFDGLLGTASGAVNDGMYADQGSRNGFWFTEVSLGKRKRVKRVKRE